MKKLLITGLLAVSSTGAFIASPVQADDNDRRGPRRGSDRDNDNDRWDRDRRPDWNGSRPGNGRPDWNGSRPGNGRPDWNGPRPGNGIPPRRPDWNGPRPGNGRPGDGRPDWNGPRPGYGTPPRPGYNGGYSGGGYNGGYYGGGYNGGYYGGGGYNNGGYYGGNNGYNNRNLENIASRIQSALRNDPQLRRYNLGTDTVGNRIELEGTVRSNSDRQRAINIARNIGGGVQINASRVRINY